MVTFHPSVTKSRGAFAPMALIRNAKGQMIGSRVSKVNLFTDKDAARMSARAAAHRAAQNANAIAGSAIARVA